MKMRELIHSLRGKLRFKARPPIPLNEYDKMKMESLINKELKGHKMKRDPNDNNRDISAI
jgi:hypothetical protein